MEFSPQKFSPLLKVSLKEGKMEVSGQKFNQVGSRIFLSSDMMTVDEITLSWLQSTIATSRFQILTGPKTKISDFVVKVKKLPLNEVLKQALEKEAQATGLLNGDIPIKFIKNRVMVKKGLLSSTSPGRLQYRSQTAGAGLKSMGNPNVNLLLNYLHDFYYDKIDLQINSDYEYNLKANMGLLGKNPQVYSGRPLKLNINLNFNLWDVFVYALRFINIPQQLEKKILERTRP
jgi:hypothetical protein